ncbi:uncharacterized protein LOC133506969 isoform X2 [Syngnathoides biaculeatus]|uniref:uncharacterized protein LOC133506969 isoform X2 n=1 Tax=Syngnathoides biaculeatus TaxID=300417 RepID=UPI002ADE602C|nr:uncharacterized protein LOC133506969 isoform X2 [Syngnathoides biaculeatus]
MICTMKERMLGVGIISSRPCTRGAIVCGDIKLFFWIKTCYVDPVENRASQFVSPLTISSPHVPKTKSLPPAFFGAPIWQLTQDPCMMASRGAKEELSFMTPASIGPRTAKQNSPVSQLILYHPCFPVHLPESLCTLPLSYPLLPSLNGSCFAIGTLLMDVRLSVPIRNLVLNVVANLLNYLAKLLVFGGLDGHQTDWGGG